MRPMKFVHKYLADPKDWEQLIAEYTGEQSPKDIVARVISRTPSTIMPIPRGLALNMQKKIRKWLK